MILSQAVILAGGKGTRLSSRLNGLPKPLIEVCGKTLLQHQIELLIRHGIEDVLILTSHGSDQIQEFFNSHSNFGINITCISDAIPLGTAGAVLSAYPYLAKNFLLLYGDTMLDVDIKRFQHVHFSRNAEITIFLHPNDHPFDSDIVEVDMDGWVKVFHPYPHNPSMGYLPNLVNAALYIIDKAKLEPFTKNIVFSDFGKDFFPKLLKMGCKIAAYKSPEYIKDCGTPNRLDKVSSDFLSGKIQASNLKFKQNGISLDRDGTINKYANYISNHSQLELLPGVSDAIRDLNKSTYRTIVVTNQPVIARGDASLADLNQIHNKLESLLAKDGAFVDSINFCPHHPDRGFKDEVLSLKINCYCRKPNIGLIEAATNDLNLDLSKSWMIGDTTIDVLTAKKAGLKSVLVETGKAGLDYKYMVSSDYVFADLKTAVSFILNDYEKLIIKTQKLLKDIRGVRVIFLGGQSRSGKSNYASIIKYALRDLGVEALNISIDGWLKNKEIRSVGVKGRYDLKGIAEFILNLDRLRNPIQIPIYNKNLMRPILSSNYQSLSKDGIVIIEGTIALDFSDLIAKELRKCIYLEIDEDLRKLRFLQEYKLRGLSNHDANQLYSSRLTDEFDEILKSKKFADLCINLTDGE